MKATLCHSNTRVMGEQSVEMQGEDNKKREGREQEAAANACGDQRSKAEVIWAMMRRVKSGFIDT